MKFLLSNDDGYDAPGLAALAQALARLGEVTVIAPHVHVSGCSHQATTHRPLQLNRVRPNWYALDGSPVDCVRVGLWQWASETDWVISGINLGGNLGADAYLSGTVAAAREACFLGKPAIAVSQYFRQQPFDWRISARWAEATIGQLLANAPPSGSFWNVNLPEPRSGATPASEHCPLDINPLPVHFEQLADGLHYRGRYQDRSRTKGHDVDVCFGGRIAVSMLRLGAETATPVQLPATTGEE